MNRKERRAAILGALAARIEDGSVIVAEKIAFAEAKTKQASDLLKALEVADAKRVLVVLPEYDETTYKCFRNMPNVTVRTAPAKAEGETGGPKTNAFSARDLLVAHKIVIAKEAFERIEQVWSR